MADTTQQATAYTPEKANEPLSPETKDICWISEYGLTQKLSKPVRCF